jgi:hypothetical protein
MWVGAGWVGGKLGVVRAGAGMWHNVCLGSGLHSEICFWRCLKEQPEFAQEIVEPGPDTDLDGLIEAKFKDSVDATIHGMQHATSINMSIGMFMSAACIHACMNGCSQ